MEKHLDRNRLSQVLIKSKKRVTDHGEVFTPPWLVETMLDLSGESDRIESRFLEPACGNGNFLIRVLQRKLAIIEFRIRKPTSDKKYFALIALMSIYGIEILEDNIVECRKRLLSDFADFLKIRASDDFFRAAYHVLSLNLIHGDALKMHTNDGRPIVFSEWCYLGSGKFRRCDFRFDQLTQASGGVITKPTKVHGSIAIGEIARGVAGRTLGVSL